MLKSLVDNLNFSEVIRPGYKPNLLDLNVFGLHFYHNMAFIEKNDNSEPSNHLVNGEVPAELRPYLIGDERDG